MPLGEGSCLSQNQTSICCLWPFEGLHRRLSLCSLPVPKQFEGSLGREFRRSVGKMQDLAAAMLLGPPGAYGRPSSQVAVLLRPCRPEARYGSGPTGSCQYRDAPPNIHSAPVRRQDRRLQEKDGSSPPEENQDGQPLVHLRIHPAERKMAPTGCSPTFGVLLELRPQRDRSASH